MPAGDLVAPQRHIRIDVPAQQVEARLEPGDQADVVPVDHPERADRAALNGAGLGSRSADINRRTVDQGAVRNAYRGVEGLATDETQPAADR
jgi:hypothetical protein